ncbi:sensor histidine kinase [Salirhabdus sp. Marseille-P4669]|uniref:sensor histidine kinase n=1 Tax=Salirhabdus sp. Marseille-P4669 TaxID=2042310 RepID=UPI000C7E7880|nr:sensor histidine kinase [Salirhabdus sp. Marseille-P4669]
MRTILKQVVVGIMIAFITSILLLSLTFLAFPLENWKELWNTSIYEVPYIILILILSIVIGMVSGLAIGLSSQQKYKILSHQLDEVIKGQKVTKEMDTSSEMKKLEDQVIQIEDKFKQQAELFQKLATERANEREISLQEVVIQERNRLARELHDSVSQQLFAASMMMSAINEGEVTSNPNMKKQLQMVEKMIHQSQMEMRALLLHLRPVALKGKSLQQGIKELLIELTQKVPMDVDWNMETFELDKGIEDQLFRILQEGVSNTLRHANANSLHVLLILRDENIIMRIIDDGVGFNVEEAKTSSYGLQNMQERALEVGGTLKIVSLENQGTRLEVKVPYMKKEDQG